MVPFYTVYGTYDLHYVFINLKFNVTYNYIYMCVCVCVCVRLDLIKFNWIRYDL